MATRFSIKHPAMETSVQLCENLHITMETSIQLLPCYTTIHIQLLTIKNQMIALIVITMVIYNLLYNHLFPTLVLSSPNRSSTNHCNSPIIPHKTPYNSPVIPIEPPYMFLHADCPRRQPRRPLRPTRSHLVSKVSVFCPMARSRSRAKVFAWTFCAAAGQKVVGNWCIYIYI